MVLNFIQLLHFTLYLNVVSLVVNFLRFPPLVVVECWGPLFVGLEFPHLLFPEDVGVVLRSHLVNPSRVLQLNLFHVQRLVFPRLLRLVSLHQMVPRWVWLLVIQLMQYVIHFERPLGVRGYLVSVRWILAHQDSLLLCRGDLRVYSWVPLCQLDFDPCLLIFTRYR